MNAERNRGGDGLHVSMVGMYVLGRGGSVCGISEVMETCGG